MTSSKWAHTLICHTTMRRNPNNFPYNPGHVTLWCVEVGLVANAREGSKQEHDWSRVHVWTHTHTHTHHAHIQYYKIRFYWSLRYIRHTNCVHTNILYRKCEILLQIICLNAGNVTLNFSKNVISYSRFCD